MTNSNDRFPAFIERVLAHEGGYSDDRNDPGNWTGGVVGKGKMLGTKYGIAANTYPNLNIRALTRDQAIAIYKRDFWDPLKANVMPPVLAFQMLDAAVNHGGTTAKRLLQRALKVADDGLIGPVTLGTLQRTDPADAVLNYFAERIQYYTRLSKFDRYGRGWMNRMVENLRWATVDN